MWGRIMGMNSSDGTGAVTAAAVLDLAWLASKAKEAGFDLCGAMSTGDLAKGSSDGELAPGLSLGEWLERGYAGEMRYLHDPRRANLTSVMPEARSVIVCATNYDQPQPYSTQAAATASTERPRGWISRYAWGDDYHVVVGEKLENLVAALRHRYGQELAARAYVDTGPVSERMLARIAGLGWQGKNTCLINQEIGSWLFLGVIITSLACAQGHAQEIAPDLCGNCRLCLDACPTGALVGPYVMDARRCISYLTIELRGRVPEELRSGMGWQVFGCDICQDVCPRNRAMAPPLESEKQPAAQFASRDGLVAPDLEWLLGLDEEEFRKRFRGSPVKRTKWRGLVRNACIAAGNALAKLKTSDEAQAVGGICARLTELAACEDAVVAEHAQWALAQFRAGTSGNIVQAKGRD